MKIRHFIAALLAVPAFASAAVISVSDQQKIKNNSQFFNFNFNNLGASSGTDGKLSITLNGDFTAGIAVENSTITVEGLGSLLLGGGWANGIGSNSVAGLTLGSYSQTTYDYDDMEYSWVFNMSNSLLNTLIADRKLAIDARDSDYVDPFNRKNQDFIRVGLSFNGAEVAQGANEVPEPASLALVGLGLAALAARRRKQA